MNKSLFCLFLYLSIPYMNESISGYVIFDYENIHGSESFDINRAYFQYSKDISEDLFFKIRFDVGRDADGEDSKLTTYVKNAYVDWNVNWGGKLSMGLIGTNTYGVQENTWGYRFIEKSALDKYKMTNTADFGIGYSVDFGNLNVNIQSLNGEGFKNSDADGDQSLYLRMLYGEGNLNNNSGYNAGVVISNDFGDASADLLGVFTGWSSDKFRVGFEYNTLETTLREEATAFYGNYSLCESWDMFLRHDIFDTNEDDQQGTSILGAVWNPTIGLYIAPNVMIGEDDNTYRLTCMFKY